MKDINEIWRSGLVRRWHCNPDLAHTNQTNAAHQWGVAMIAMYLFPGYTSLIEKALTHDIGEVNIGDVSAEAKRSNTELKKLLKEEEDRNLKSMGLEDTDPTNDCLHLCDMLEAYMWARQHNPEILETEPWLNQISEMQDMASELEVYYKTLEILK